MPTSSSVRIARIGGVDIRLDLTWFLGAFLFAAPIWTAFGSDHRRAFIFSAMTVALFFGSVFLHEIAHVVSFRAHGIAVHDVTLWLFGGFTRAESGGQTPMAEFVISSAGPLASAGVGLALLAASLLLRPGPTRFLVERWGNLNLWLAAINALPGFPLDGGHALRALIWRWTGHPDRATVMAARVGQGVGALLIGALLVPNITFGILSPIGLALIGFFMIAIATTSARDAQARVRLAETKVRSAMGPPPASIPATLPLGQARDTYLNPHPSEAFPVIDGGHLLGFVSLATAVGMPPHVPVRSATVASSTVIEAHPDEPMLALVTKMRDANASTALVMEGGTPVGLIGGPGS